MSSLVKFCSLDPTPTFLLREHVDLLPPYVTAIVNASLSQGRLSDSQNVLPLLNKSGLHSADMAQISNLSFLSKAGHRSAASQ